MRDLIIIGLLVSTPFILATTEHYDCHGIVIRNFLYERHLLESRLDSSQLAVDYKTNILFYSDYSENKYLYIGGIRTHSIDRNTEVVARAVDNKLHRVYMGGEDGIYEFDYNSKAAIKLNLTNDNIHHLFIKDFIYYTSEKQKAYVIKDGKKTLIPELEDFAVRVLAVDKGNNIFFSNDTGLFEYKKDTKQVLHIGDYKVNGFAADTKGKLYFSTRNGIYYINEQKQVEQIELIENTRAITIDGEDNIIYCAGSRIVQLKNTNKMCSPVKKAKH